jgi:hypothetical protein
VLAGGDRHHQFGAHAVGGGNQDRIEKSSRLQVEPRAEAPEASRGAGPRRGLGQGLDRLDKRRAGIDIDAGIAIAAGVYGVLRGDGL